ncbi:MAG: hypothetical protein ABI542_05200 [Gemmatimonadota bacterium]
MSGFRKLRAALVIALTWGVFWGVVGPLLAAAISLVIGASGPFSDGLGTLAWLFVTYAFVGGAMGLGFAGLTMILGRRKGWSLTRGRAILLGAFGGLVAYGLYGAGMGLVKGWIPNFGALPAAMVAGIGAITGVLTFGTAARGKLPAGNNEPKRIEE